MTLNARKANTKPHGNLGPWVLATVCCLASPLATAQSSEGRWYLGIGAGTSLLTPDTVAGIDTSDAPTIAGTLFFGRDLARSTSVQLQLHALGDVDFDNDDGARDGQSAIFSAADLSVLYRFLDTRSDTRASGFSLFGRFGAGVLERDSDLSLVTDEPLWFGAGGGLEWHLSHDLTLRAEGLYLDADAAAAYVSLIGRFGGSAAPAVLPTPPASLVDTTAATAPEVAPAPGTTTPAPSPSPSAATPLDSDGDGVQNNADSCPNSTPGFPVTDIGCALLDGVLTGVRFADESGQLLPGAAVQLDFLADLLDEFPAARVELHAHSDNAGTPREQAVITRARLRTVGTYLINRGISASRLVLRSFGGSRPLFDNTTAEGRADNNRIEILEHRP